MQYPFVIDSQKQPLMPCHPARARKLLKAGLAAIWRRRPFTIILKDRDGGDVQPLALKIDPGSRTTGLALLSESETQATVVWEAELEHRGQAVHEALEARRAIRHSRRARHTRYRKPRFLNRHTKQEGWLPPSLNSRIDNITHWTIKLAPFCPINRIAQGVVKFDTQLLENPNIVGIEYQQGTLAGYEMRQYLLEKWGRLCAYCGVKNVPFEIEHIVPRSRGGSSRASNLTIACHDCNQAKGDKTAAEFGHPAVQKQARLPLRDAAAVNTTRWALYHQLETFGWPIETGSGGRTKWNRVSQSYPKAHWIDAACAGESGALIWISADHVPLLIKAMGRGNRQMCRVDKYGFPRTGAKSAKRVKSAKSAKSAKRVKGFQTGDLVKAVVPNGKHQGTHIGRVAVRTSGSFNLTTSKGTMQGISHKYCIRLQHTDGYEYSKGETAFPPHA